MEDKRKAVLIGATGLVGKELLTLLLAEGHYKKVQVLARKPAVTTHPKLEWHTVNFDEPEAYTHLLDAHDAYCCLGTTMKNAGSKEAFYKVDFTYVVQFAEACQQRSVKNFFLVSSMGANADSFFFYNRVKGETEKRLQEMNFSTLQIFRPSMLLGKRDEVRLGEGIGKGFVQVFSPVIARRYRGIPGKTVAKAMLLKAKKPGSGVQVYLSDKIHDICQRGQ